MIRTMMTQRCTVARDTQTARDPFNQPATPILQVLHEALPCWFWSLRAMHKVEIYRTAELQDIIMMVPRTTDIRVDDVVYNIRGRDATSIDSRRMRVQTVRNRQKWISVTLDMVA